MAFQLRTRFSQSTEVFSQAVFDSWYGKNVGTVQSIDQDARSAWIYFNDYAQYIKYAYVYLADSTPPTADVINEYLVSVAVFL